jgi:hypothetical protein
LYPKNKLILNFAAEPNKKGLNMRPKIWVKDKTERVIGPFDPFSLSEAITNESGEIIKGFDALGVKHELLSHTAFRSRLNRQQNPPVWVRDGTIKVDSFDVNTLLDKTVKNGKIIKGVDALGGEYELISQNALMVRLNVERKGLVWVRDGTIKVEHCDVKTLLNKTVENGKIIKGFDALGVEHELLSHTAFRSRLNRQQNPPVWVRDGTIKVDRFDVNALLNKTVENGKIIKGVDALGIEYELISQNSFNSRLYYKKHPPVWVRDGTIKVEHFDVKTLLNKTVKNGKIIKGFDGLGVKHELISQNALTQRLHLERKVLVWVRDGTIKVDRFDVNALLNKTVENGKIIKGVDGFGIKHELISQSTLRQRLVLKQKIRRGGAAVTKLVSTNPRKRPLESLLDSAADSSVSQLQSFGLNNFEFPVFNSSAEYAQNHYLQGAGQDEPTDLASDNDTSRRIRRYPNSCYVQNAVPPEQMNFLPLLSTTLDCDNRATPDTGQSAALPLYNYRLTNIDYMLAEAVGTKIPGPTLLAVFRAQCYYNNKKLFCRSQPRV